MTPDPIRLDGKLDLIPVVNTYRYIPHPFEDTAQRHTFVKQVMEQSPEPACGWYVLPSLPDETIPVWLSVETLTDAGLITTLIKRRIDFEARETRPNRLIHDAGFVLQHRLEIGTTLRHEDTIIYAPQCCCELRDIAEWKQVLDQKTPDWTSIWIGHPMVYTRYEAGRVLITEPNNDPPRPIMPRYSVNADHLREAVERAAAIGQAFMDQVRAVLRQMQIDQANGPDR